jgi:hypothetical protein
LKIWLRVRSSFFIFLWYISVMTIHVLCLKSAEGRYFYSIGVAGNRAVRWNGPFSFFDSLLGNFVTCEGETVRTLIGLSRHTQPLVVCRMITAPGVSVETSDTDLVRMLDSRMTYHIENALSTLPVDEG